MQEIDLSDAHEKARRAFGLYNSAIRCFLVMRGDVHNSPDISQELPKLNVALDSIDEEDLYAEYGAAWWERFEFESSLISEVRAVRERTPTYDDMHRLSSYLVALASRELPPLRRVDWCLRWESARLLDLKRVGDDFDQWLGEPECDPEWRNQNLEKQSKSALEKIDKYFTEDSPTSPGLSIYEKIEEACPYPKHFRVPVAFIHSRIWAWDLLKASIRPSELLEDLSKEYLGMMDEWAHIYFEHPKALEEQERNMKREASLRIFGGINHAIDSNRERFSEASSAHDMTDLLLPFPEQCDSLEEWHKVCIEGPIEKLGKRIDAAKQYEFRSGYRNYLPSFITLATPNTAKGTSGQGYDKEELIEEECVVTFSKGFRVGRLSSDKEGDRTWIFGRRQPQIVQMLYEAHKKKQPLLFKEIKEQTGSKATSLSNAFRGKTKDFYETLIEHSPSGKSHLYSFKKTFFYKPE